MTSSTARLLCRLAALSIVISASLPVSAQNQGITRIEENEMGDDERAKAHFRVGQSLYDAGRFNEAAEEWQKAFDLSQRSELLYNIYVAYRDGATSNDKAVAALQRFLELGQMDATRRLQLEARLGAMQEALARNAAPAPVEPEPAPMEPTPAPVATTEDSGGSSLVVPIVVMATGGVFLAVSAFAGLRAIAIESGLEDDCMPNNVCPANVDLKSERDKGKTFVTINTVTGIVGLAGVATGVVLLLLNMNDNESADTTGEASASRVSFGCTDTGCTGVLQGTF